MRPPKLTGSQLRRLYELIVGHDPRQLAFDFASWTREMVRQLIRRELGVSMSASAVSRLLHRLGHGSAPTAGHAAHRAFLSDPDLAYIRQATQTPVD